ncbi:coenzyme F390 synthetase [soil metagenome]
MQRAAELAERIVAYMGGAKDDFGALATEVFRHQYRSNAPYRAYCDARRANPDTVLSWQQVPAVPADAFKAASLVCGDPADSEAVYRTSGTTGGADRRGTHYVLDLTLYDAALRIGFARHLLPDTGRMRIVSLVPPAAEQPDSSLSHMLREVVAEFGTPASTWRLTAAEGLDLPGLLRDLDEVEGAREPVLLAGTSFTFVHLFEALNDLGRSYRLPPGSRAMDTGGFKGRSREVARAELVQRFEEMLGITPEWLVNEYGMTEMSSQFYDGVAGLPLGGESRYVTPHWVRTLAVDPETLGPLAPGETGVLRHCDLGNLNSVMMIQTADLGSVHANGFSLLGRAPGAEARGCSIAMDELLQAIRKR